MEFIDLKRQQARLNGNVNDAIARVLDHGRYIMGPEVEQLEQTLAQYVGVDHAIGVANGTDALFIAMMALGVGHGDEVITTPFTFIATGEMISLLGAKPVFVDIDPFTYNIDVNKIKDVITEKTKCIMPVSLYGQCANFKEINKIAKDYNLPVIEDGAQSFGATHHEIRSCGLTTIGCTSFFPSKPLGGYGDGGMCFTDDPDLAQRIRKLRLHGQERRYYHTIIGINSRLDTLQAAILLAKFTIFPEEVSTRERIAAHYTSLLKDLVQTPVIEHWNTSVYAQYTIAVNDREGLQSILKEQGIPTAIHYPQPLHLQPAFDYLNYKVGDCPVAEAAANKVMSLPMHPYLSDEEINKVVNAIEHVDTEMIA